MRILPFCFLMILLSLQSCLPLDDKSEVISFWTDSDLEADINYTLYINEIEAGVISKSYESTVCGMEGLINVNILDEKDMNLEIRNSNGQIVNIGIINLSSPSTGIMVKPNIEDTIYVSHDIDDPCTLVRIRW